MQIGAEKLCDEVAIGSDVSGVSEGRRRGNAAKTAMGTYMSSRGEMKMSLREITCVAPNVSMIKRDGMSSQAQRASSS